LMGFAWVGFLATLSTSELMGSPSARIQSHGYPLSHGRVSGVSMGPFTHGGSQQEWLQVLR